ncbi:MAG: PEP-CTERM sorting domain-containing protein [Propionivibrio sp.]|uniref:PEP-CTERM sorting domain-containing protein n=1 Tax=Propionivibrio sp. TaxID=2212460 RepID=UPI001A4CBC60|nr:PEP-CTERM sorting domain-containing protein [Propionivibrio sp.]MBL8416487.1 PEP-CTERM sorting domain-containing protein [Propionivibrio sp.]
MRVLSGSTIILALGCAFTTAQAAPALESYSLTAAGISRLGAAGPGFSCATFGPDPRTAYFQGNFQVGLPTDGGACGVGSDSRSAVATSGVVNVAAALAVSFGPPGDLRAFTGSAKGRAGFGDLGVRAAASYSGSSDSFTVVGSQAYGLQTETITFGGASGAGVFRPTFTVDGSLFNLGRTDSQLGFFYSVGNGPHFLAFRIQNSRGSVSYYMPGGYVASLPGMALTGDLVTGLTVSGSTTFSIDVPIVFGSALDVTYGLWGASLPSSSVGLLTGSGGDVSFLSSARMTGIEVLGATGQPVPGFSVISGSGTLYGAAGVLPAVPEPGSTAMMILGLAALLVRRLYWH